MPLPVKHLGHLEPPFSNWVLTWAVISEVSWADIDLFAIKIVNFSERGAVVGFKIQDHRWVLWGGEIERKAVLGFCIWISSEGGFRVLVRTNEVGERTEEGSDEEE